MTIPDTIVSDIMTSVVTVFDGCKALIIALFGIGLVFFIARKIRVLLPK